MKRRGFLATIGAFAGTAVLDPEKLLWIAGKKTIFIPKPSKVADGLFIGVDRKSVV